MVEISDQWRRAAGLIQMIQRGEQAASAAAAAGDQDMAWLWLFTIGELSGKLSEALEEAAQELVQVQDPKAGQ